MSNLTLQQLYPQFLSQNVATKIHLQWFAAEDEGRTEDPTERKIRKARDISGTLSLLQQPDGFCLFIKTHRN
jgi:hypothetical protein